MRPSSPLTAAASLTALTTGSEAGGLRVDRLAIAAAKPARGRAAPAAGVTPWLDVAAAG